MIILQLSVQNHILLLYPRVRFPWDRAFLYKENPALDAGFRERYAFDQKSSNR